MMEIERLAIQSVSKQCIVDEQFSIPIHGRRRMMRVTA